MISKTFLHTIIAISTAIVEIKINKQLHALKTRYVNNTPCRKYKVRCRHDFHCKFDKLWCTMQRKYDILWTIEIINNTGAGIEGKIWERAIGGGGGKSAKKYCFSSKKTFKPMSKYPGLEFAHQ